MWQGPVWINTSWLVATGFTRCGRPDVAEHIRRRTLDVMQRWQTERGCIFEFYDDDDQVPPPDLPRKGKNAPEIHPYHQVMHDFGWSATLALDWLFTETRGLSQHS
jgi:neutral trehalase